VRHSDFDGRVAAVNTAMMTMSLNVPVQCTKMSLPVTVTLKVF